MPILQDLVQGFARAAGANDSADAIQKNKDHHAEFSDFQRKQQIESYHKIGEQVNGILASGQVLDKSTGAMRPLTDQDRQHLTAVTKAVNDTIGRLSNPQQQNPLRAATDALHVTKKKPAEQMADLQQLTSEVGQFDTNEKHANPYAEDKRLMVQGGFSPEDANKKQRIDAGLDPKAATPRQKTVTSIEPDPESPTGYSKVTSDQATGDEISRQNNVLPPRGFVGTETDSTDPFGQTTHTTRKPITPGGKPEKAPEGKKPAGVQKKELQAMTGKSGTKVDEQGHIPQTAKVNPNLREAANQLLDGKSTKDLQVPAKDKAAAESLARQFGWAGEGVFTPKDKIMLRESESILTQLSKSDSLTVLDDAFSRQKIAQVLQNPDKRGFIGQAFQNITAGNLDKKEQEFVTLYNQAVGRIAGLSQLVRSGRATEATIERLKLELPSPYTTTSSEHARQKLAQIQNEINIAMDKGQFTESGASSDDDIIKALSGK